MKRLRASFARRVLALGDLPAEALAWALAPLNDGGNSKGVGDEELLRTHLRDLTRTCGIWAMLLEIQVLDFT